MSAFIPRLLIVGVLATSGAFAAALENSQVAEASDARPTVHNAAPAVKPFHVGEKLTYNAKINFLHVGSGTMTVQGIENVRGHDTYHTVFTVKGRMLFFSVNDFYESWFDTTSLVSLRYRQKIDEGSYEADRRYEMYPERKTFSENEKPEEPGVSQPLDDGSFIYFVRSLPLDSGETYEFFRYFKPDRNPVRLEVVRKERIKVPAGEFNAIVVHPQIKSKGIFSNDSNAEIWFSDDSARVMLRMRSGLPFGTLQLELKEIGHT